MRLDVCINAPVNIQVSIDSVDLSRANIRFCRRKLLPGTTSQMHAQDSVDWLITRTEPIHLLYLDSADYPYQEIFAAFTHGKSDQASIDYIENVVDPATIQEKCSTSIMECQMHALKELMAAEERIVPGGLVLIDDWGLPCGGKARLAREYMRRNGFHLVCEAYQTLWRKNS